MIENPSAVQTAPQQPGSDDSAVCDAPHSHPDTVAHVRKVLIDDSDVTSLAETFRALGDTTRVRLLDALSKAELCVCDLAALLGLSESAVSHQLRLLRGLRLVRPRRQGRLVFYALDDAHIMDLFRQGLAHVGESVVAGRSALRMRPNHFAAPSPAEPDRSRRPASDDLDASLTPGRRWE